MLKRVWASFIHRGVSFWFALGVGLNAGGSAMLITYIIGGLCLLIALGIFIYNLKQPIEDQIPSMLDTIKDSKVVWGFWHSGVRAKEHFQYGTVKRMLLLEPNPDNEAFKHVLAEMRGKTTQQQVLTEINLTKEMTLANHHQLEITKAVQQKYDKLRKQGR